jgi:hypothetical protein
MIYNIPYPSLERLANLGDEKLKALFYAKQAGFIIQLCNKKGWFLSSKNNNPIRLGLTKRWSANRVMLIILDSKNFNYMDILDKKISGIKSIDSLNLENFTKKEDKDRALIYAQKVGYNSRFKPNKGFILTLGGTNGWSETITLGFKEDWEANTLARMILIDSNFSFLDLPTNKEFKYLNLNLDKVNFDMEDLRKNNS